MVEFQTDHDYWHHIILRLYDNNSRHRPFQAPVWFKATQSHVRKYKIRNWLLSSWVGKLNSVLLHRHWQGNIRLAFIFRFVSIGNLVWIVFSVISVEMTLNWDFVTEVQSRSHNIGTPSQLLPLLIGLFQFVRIAWLAIRDHFFGGEENAEQIVARTEAVIIKSKARYLVAWLPWLSHFSFWTVARPISVLGNSELGKQSRENSVQEHGGSDLPRKEADVSLSPLSPVFGEKEVRFWIGEKEMEVADWSPTWRWKTKFKSSAWLFAWINEISKHAFMSNGFLTLIKPSNNTLLYP